MIKRSTNKPVALSAADHTEVALVPSKARDSLAAWCEIYLQVTPGSDNTLEAKQNDLRVFLQFLTEAAGTDHCDQWTPSLTSRFLEDLRQAAKEKVSTLNRRLATLKHAARWIHRQRPFLAGDPTAGIKDYQTKAPEWQGITSLNVTRLLSAAEQLMAMKTGTRQRPIRNYAMVRLLLHAGMRISELLSVDLEHYRHKHLRNVKRKGKLIEDVFVPKKARQALDRYIREERGDQPGPLICSWSGARLARQQADTELKAIAAQANSTLPAEEHIRISAHLFRHTNLRQKARKFGVEFAKLDSGQVSDRYIWRYVQPSAAEKEAAAEELF